MKVFTVVWSVWLLLALLHGVSVLMTEVLSAVWLANLQSEDLSIGLAQDSQV